MNYIGVSKKSKEIPDICKMNFSLLQKYLSLSKTNVHGRFLIAINQMKMRIRDKKTFENTSGLHQFYMKVFTNIFVNFFKSMLL